MLRFVIPALLASAAMAQVSYYSAALEAAQEVPPNTSVGRGWGVVRLDAGTGQVRIFEFYENLTGAPTASHLHLAPAGANGGVIVPLTAAGANSFTGTATLTPAQVTALQTAGTYLNVHTAANPGGEIRGQVVTSISTRYTGVLAATNEVPPNTSAATGTAIAWLHEPENRIVYIVNGTGFSSAVTAAHFHQAAAGVNGPVVVPLNGSNGTYCGVSGRLNATQLAAWQANGFYANIHTSTNPGGEIRAQMIKDAGDHFVALCDNAQEVPPTIGTGIGEFNVIANAAGVLSLTGQFSGLTGPAIAAHVHVGAVGVSGGVVWPLTIAGSSLTGTFTPTAADLLNLRAGNWYVNIHTAANPGGEIRGQLGRAQMATTFGEGCLSSSGTRPQIGATGFPAVGTSMSVDLYGGLPNGLVVFAFSPNRDSASGLPLPVELTTVGINAPKCFVLIDPTTTLVTFTNALGCANQNLSLPLVPAFRGATFYSQWFLFDGNANPGGLVVSSALTLPIQ